MKGELQQIRDWVQLARRARWSVAELARLCGISTRTLERYFQETHNQSPAVWLAELRWQESMELLGGGTSVKTTAAELGYRQASTFSREFKKRFGQSPVIFANKPALKSASLLMSH